MAQTTLVDIYAAARAAAAAVEVNIYIGSLADFATEAGVASTFDPVLVLEYPTGSDTPLSGGNAIKTAYSLRGYMLTSDAHDSTSDAVLEPSEFITPRQLNLEAMDALMTSFIFAFRDALVGINAQFTSAGNGQSYWHFTPNPRVGVGRTFGATVVNVTC